MKTPGYTYSNPVSRSDDFTLYQAIRDLDPNLIPRSLSLGHYAGSLALLMVAGADRSLAAQLDTPMDIGTFLKRREPHSSSHCQ